MLTRTDLQALSLVNVKQGYACGGHGSCILAPDPQTGIQLPTGCNCQEKYMGYFAFTHTYSDDCTVLDGTTVASAAVALKTTSGCKIKGNSTHPTTLYQARCELACPCNYNYGAALDCVNEQYLPYQQGQCKCNTTWAGATCSDCAPKYFGIACDVFCDPKTTCRSKGDCNSAGRCDCKMGWYGTNCEKMTCKECNNRGGCIEGPACDCQQDYTGASCEYEVQWDPTSWGICRYTEPSQLCGAGTQTRVLKAKKRNFVSGNLTWKSSDVFPTLAAKPAISRGCVHPQRVSCLCAVPPMKVVNGLDPICSTVADGATCALQCEKGYVPYGVYSCVKGAYQKPDPTCVKYEADAIAPVAITALRQTLAFQLTTGANATKWADAMQSELGPVLSTMTGIPATDIEITNVAYTAAETRQLEHAAQTRFDRNPFFLAAQRLAARHCAIIDKFGATQFQRVQASSKVLQNALQGGENYHLEYPDVELISAQAGETRQLGGAASENRNSRGRRLQSLVAWQKLLDKVMVKSRPRPGTAAQKDVYAEGLWLSNLEKRKLDSAELFPQTREDTPNEDTTTTTSESSPALENLLVLARRRLQTVASVPMSVEYLVKIYDTSVLTAVQWRLQNLATSPEDKFASLIKTALASQGIDTDAELAVRWAVTQPTQTSVFEVLSTTTTSTSSTSTSTSEPPIIATAAPKAEESKTTFYLTVLGCILVVLAVIAFIVWRLYRRKQKVAADKYATKVEAERVEDLKVGNSGRQVQSRRWRPNGWKT